MAINTADCNQTNGLDADQEDERTCNEPVHYKASDWSTEIPIKHRLAALCQCAQLTRYDNLLMSRSDKTSTVAE